MQLTLFGLVVLALGPLLLLFGGTVAMLVFVLAMSMLGGSAAIILTSLGGSSIPPGSLALVFLVLRCLLPSPGQAERLQAALIANRLLAVFSIYGALGAWLLPRLFAGAVAVTPLHPVDIAYIYAVSPLRFSSQNVTVSFYFIGTLLGAICGYVAGSRDGAARAVARLGAVIAIVHAALGIASVVFRNSAILAFFRNGAYAQLNQSLEGISRMSGIWAEPATYSAYGIIWLIFTAELWLRGVERRWTMPGFVAIFTALLLSTSTTAYVGLGAYAVILALRQTIAPGTIRFSVVLGVTLGIAAAACMVLAILILDRGLVDRLDHLTSVLLADKLSSRSGLQRVFWARQGLDAFRASYGFGVGPGSFRSSSLLTAILGSTGAIGTAAFLLYLFRTLAPLRASTYVVLPDPRYSVGVAASWTAAVMLIPAFFSAASPDPGYVWAIMSGLALALRSAPPRPATMAGSSPATAAVSRLPRTRPA